MGVRPYQRRVAGFNTGGGIVELQGMARASRGLASVLGQLGAVAQDFSEAEVKTAIRDEEVALNGIEAQADRTLGELFGQNAEDPDKLAAAWDAYAKQQVDGYKGYLKPELEARLQGMVGSRLAQASINRENRKKEQTLGAGVALIESLGNQASQAAAVGKADPQLRGRAFAELDKLVQSGLIREDQAQAKRQEFDVGIYAAELTKGAKEAYGAKGYDASLALIDGWKASKLPNEVGAELRDRIADKAKGEVTNLYNLDEHKRVKAEANLRKAQARAAQEVNAQVRVALANNDFVGAGQIITANKGRLAPEDLAQSNATLDVARIQMGQATAAARIGAEIESFLAQGKGTDALVYLEGTGSELDPATYARFEGAITKDAVMDMEKYRIDSAKQIQADALAGQKFNIERAVQDQQLGPQGIDLLIKQGIIPPSELDWATGVRAKAVTMAEANQKKMAGVYAIDAALKAGMPLGATVAGDLDDWIVQFNQGAQSGAIKNADGSAVAPIAFGQAGSVEQQVELITKVGAIPKSFVDGFAAARLSKDPDRLAYARELYRAIEASPRGALVLDQLPQDVKGFWSKMIERGGDLDPVQAAELTYKEQSDPSDPSVRRAQNAIATDPGLIDRNLEGQLEEKLGSLLPWRDFDLEDVPEGMKSAYQQAFMDEFTVHGNVHRAARTAWDKVASSWQVTNIGPTRLVRQPPDQLKVAADGVLPDIWMRDHIAIEAYQLLKSGKGPMRADETELLTMRDVGSMVDSGEIFVEPAEGTKPGEANPLYRIVIDGPSGFMYLPGRMEFRWEGMHQEAWQRAVAKRESDRKQWSNELLMARDAGMSEQELLQVWYRRELANDETYGELHNNWVQDFVDKEVTRTKRDFRKLFRDLGLIEDQP
jgi:hypothetical protein